MDIMKPTAVIGTNAYNLWLDSADRRQRMRDGI